MNPKFIEMIEAEKSQLFDGLLAALNESPSLSIRKNKFKTPSVSFQFPECQQVPWEENGFYLKERPNFAHDPMWHQGAYYVQDPSSMILGEIIRNITQREDNRPLTVLDACAAPGGKTTSILDALPKGSVVIANEYDYHRAEILRENIEKWGRANVAVTRGETSQFKNIHSLFDVILADMPCSGEGMFRKDEFSREQWSESLVYQCQSRQLDIAKNLIPSLKTGGYLIYSTCTFNTLENEKNVEKICAEFGLESVKIDIPEEWKITEAINSDIHAMRFLPQNLKGEGLFVSVLRKPGKLKTKTLEMKNSKQSILPKGWIHSTFVSHREGDIIWVATPELAVTIKKIGNKVQCLTQGIEAAKIKNHDIIPTHAFSLSEAIGIETFPHVEVDLQTALRYLRRETITLPPDTPCGYIILTYAGLPLGFVKNMGQRINNLLPKEWKLRI